MDGRVMIGDRWFNLEGVAFAERRDESRTVVILYTAGHASGFSAYGPTADALWEHMKKHSYNIVLEENNDAD